MKKILLLLLFSSFRFANADVVTGTATPGLLTFDNLPEALYDFNNNGLFDLDLRVIKISGNNYELFVKGLNGAQVEISNSDNVMGYSQGTLEGVNTYKDSGYVRVLYFPQSSQRYIGFKFSVNGQLCCGYLRISAADYVLGSFSFDSFGYETTNAICISAGDFSTDISNTAGIFNDIIVTQNNSILEVTSTLASFQIQIYDLIGNKIYESVNYTGAAKIPIAGISNTMLFIKLSDMADLRKTKVTKFILQ